MFLPHLFPIMLIHTMFSVWRQRLLQSQRDELLRLIHSQLLLHGPYQYKKSASKKNSRRCSFCSLCLFFKLLGDHHPTALITIGFSQAVNLRWTAPILLWYERQKLFIQENLGQWFYNCAYVWKCLSTALVAPSKNYSFDLTFKLNNAFNKLEYTTNLFEGLPCACTSTCESWWETKSLINGVYELMKRIGY